MDEIAKRDQNFVTVLMGVTDDVDQDITMLRVDPISKRLLVSATAGGSASLTATYVGYGSPTNVLTGDANLTYDSVNQIFSATILLSKYSLVRDNKPSAVRVASQVTNISSTGVSGIDVFNDLGGSPSGRISMATYGSNFNPAIGLANSALIESNGAEFVIGNYGNNPIKFYRGTSYTAATTAMSIEANGPGGNPYVQVKTLTAYDTIAGGGQNGVYICNFSSTGASSFGGFNNNQTTAWSLIQFGTANNPSGGYVNSGLYLQTNGPALGIGTNTGVGGLLFYTGGNPSTNTRMTIASTGEVNIGNASSTNQRLVRIGQNTAFIDIGSLVTSTSNAAIYLNQATPSAINFTLATLSGGTYLNADTGTFIVHSVGSSNMYQINADTQTWTPNANNGSSSVTFNFLNPANIGRGTGANVNNFKVTGNTQQWTTGALPTQYFNYFSANTLSFIGASTATSVYANYFESTIAGTNATITNNYSAGFSGGNGIVIEGTSATGITLTGGTNQTVGANANLRLLAGSGAEVIFDINSLFAVARISSTRFLMNGDGQFLVGSSTQGIKMQGLIGTLSIPAIYFETTTPSATNYGIAADTNDFLINGASSVQLRIANTNIANINSTGLQITGSITSSTLTSGFFPVASTGGLLINSALSTTNLVSNNFTPTATNVTNITSSTPNNATYQRVGNIVNVFGTITVTNTLAVASEVDVSLPVASNLGSATDLNGLATMDSTASVNIYINADATNDRARIFFTSAGVGQTSTIYYSYSYKII